MRLFSFLFLFILITFSSCNTTKSTVSSNNQSFRFAFYNVENLFDTFDDPKINDQEFLPGTEMDWNIERYNKKLSNIAKVIASLNFPDAMGLCEIENKKVVEDLVNLPQLKDYNYKIVHYDSPDMRGIDVAFIYKNKNIKLVSSEKINVDFPNDIDPKNEVLTRDILHIVTKVDGEKFNFFVNHWPSRRGGEKDSEPKRKYVASLLKAKVDEIYKANPEAKILIAGDFNDSPSNKSLVEVLQARPNVTNFLNNNDQHLINFSAALALDGKGSHYYESWDMLDQVILSSAFVDSRSKWKVKDNSAVVFSDKYLLFEDKKKGPVPSKTYGGTKYYGGYSDHLPVYIDLIHQ